MRLRHWIKEGAKYFLALTGGSFLYSLLMIIQDNDWGLKDLLLLSGMFQMVFSVMIGMILNITLYTTSHSGISLAMSFGSTRKELFVGLQLYRLPPLLLSVALGTIAFALGGNVQPDNYYKISLSVLGLSLLLQALGIVIGIVSFKLGKLAGIIAGIISGFASVFIVAGSVIYVNGGSPIPDFLPILLLIAGIAVYGLVGIMENALLKQFNAKL